MSSDSILMTRDRHAPDDIGDLFPLPQFLHQGLAAVAVFGFLSFFTSFALFVFLTVKIIRWQLRPRAAPESTGLELKDTVSITNFNGCLLPDEHLCPQKGGAEPQVRPATLRERIFNDPPNQFLVLIVNLLLADIQQAMAFLLNVTWISKDGIDVNTATCWAQGWFVSTGDLASSVFLSAIATHTYLAIVRGYRMPTWMFYLFIFLCWAFVFGTAILGVIITNNGSDVGGLYVRAGAWCWINGAYQDLRLFLHYLWIFVSLGFTSFIYVLIFFHIKKLNLDNERNLAAPTAINLNRLNNQASSSSSNLPSAHSKVLENALRQEARLHQERRAASNQGFWQRLAAIRSSIRQQTFLLYPIIYVACTTPLAAGRIASMAGHKVPLGYFCFAGAMIACNGWLDVVLYSLTRRSIIFYGDAGAQDTGLETFAFMRTPPNRRFGNMVTVTGGAGDAHHHDHHHGHKHSPSKGKADMGFIDTESQLGSNSSSSSSGLGKKNKKKGGVLSSHRSNNNNTNNTNNSNMGQSDSGGIVMGSGGVVTGNFSGGSTESLRGHSMGQSNDMATDYHSHHHHHHSNSKSNISGGTATLGGMAIQYETTTTVVVELDEERKDRGYVLPRRDSGASSVETLRLASERR